MKVLIIGAKGMLGQELARVFGAAGNYEVILWDFEDIDISNEAWAREKITALAPQIIINAAAYNAVDKAEESAEFEIAKKINGLAPGYLAQIAKDLNAFFVQYSSDYVFDGEKKEGYREDDAPHPISKYGESKLIGEREVAENGEKYYIIRLQKLFGRPGTSSGAKKSFFEMMLELAKTKEELELVDEELANFTYAPDLAVQIKYLIENNLPFGIYHIINEGAPVTWFGAARVLFELTGNSKIRLKPIGSDKFSRPAKRPKYTILLNTKLPPLRPWPEALKEFLRNK
jgi:dTDP-4-dehydrorhamnose reductase